MADRISLAPVLWRVADLWVEETDHNHKTLANRAIGNSSAFDRLRGGAGITLRNFERLLTYLLDPENWPDDIPDDANHALGLLTSVSEEINARSSGHRLTPSSGKADDVSARCAA